MGERICIERVWLEWPIDDMTDNACELVTDVVDGKITNSCRYSNSDIDEHGYEAVMKWIGQDLERYRGFMNGLWHYIGCVAKAEVSYDIGNGSKRLEVLSSGGLYGIDSDSSQEYFFEVAADEFHDLCEHLTTFGVDTYNFEALVANTTFRP